MFSFGFFNMPNLITVLFIVNIVIALTIIFLERKNPSATLAWIMILFLLPIVGIVFYFLFSQNIARKKIFKLTKYEAEVLGGSLHEQTNSMINGSFEFTNKESKKWYDMIRLNQTNALAYFTQNNSISIITDGKHMFNSLLEDIKNAKETINITYYIVKYDSVGRTLIDALIEKAKEGVEVRLLLDAMGSRQINEKRLQDFINAGGKAAFFFPPKFKCLNMKLNYRNHRKLVVIDDEVGYLGGFNIANEYLGKVKKFGYWRDTHLKLTGGCVQDMNARFILDWRFASKEKLVMAQAYYNEPKEVGITGIQIVASGPDSPREEVKQGYLKMISSAKKNIYIQSPYFVPDASIMEALKTAVLCGVDVRIMIPCMPDHMFVYWATYSYVGILANLGAKIYIYDNGFLHAKTMAVDGEVGSIGSANFDIRSFRLNFEANAFIYDAEEVYKLESIFEEDMIKSHELTRSLYRNRPLIVKFKESVSRLLSDLL
ncbi:cardiolipin synthase [Anaerovorax odorimutans]|uniref:cardiolipin synthase n=1 Tax=Anaerovorax odorimutans TaxID=109327 RepID=UPI00040C26A2|nr:cardiolipin synthase [Anaerovorax odorimutans]